MKSTKPIGLAILGAASLALTGSAFASVVYDASYAGTATLPYYFSANAYPYGDEITLAGTDRVLTKFSFSYYSDYAAPYDGILGASVAFLANDGPGGSPGSLLFLDFFDIEIGLNGIDVDIPFLPDFSDPLPDTFTWAVQFVGPGTAGLLIADAPTIGSSYDDYWEFDGTDWVTRQLVGGYTSNFEATVTAIAVPEASPGLATALAFAGIGALTVYRRSRRNQN